MTCTDSRKQGRRRVSPFWQPKNGLDRAILVIVGLFAIACLWSELSISPVMAGGQQTSNNQSPSINLSAFQDTLDPESPLYGHALPPTRNTSRDPSVPFVELDTVSHDKKLCFLPKLLISDKTLDALYPRVVASGRSVLAAFEVDIGNGHRYIAVTHSTDFGLTWSEPVAASNPDHDAGRLRLCIGDSSIGLAYYEVANEPYQTIFFREISLERFGMAEPVGVDTGDYSGNPKTPDIAATDTALFIAYHRYHDNGSWFWFRRSPNWGQSWEYLSGEQFTSAGLHHLVLTDSLLSVVYPAS